MRWKRARWLTLIALLPACNAHLVDRTQQYSPLLNELKYPLSIEITREFFVLSNSIRVKAIVDGNEHPMTGQGEGLWTARVPVTCKQPPLRYSYRLHWQYLALLIPIARDRTYPEQGTYEAAFNPPAPFTAPAELSFYGEKSVVVRTVQIVAQAADGVTVLGVTIGPLPTPTGGQCLGDCSGSSFVLRNLPALPVQLTCGGNTQFDVHFFSTAQSSGTLNISTNKGAHTILMQGKIFVFG